MSKLLFFGASVSQLPAIRHARAAGHVVVACDGDPHAVALDLCDVAEVVDFSDVDRVTAVAARERVDGLLAVCTDRAVVPAALVAERLGLPGIGPEVAHAMTHKPTMRRVLYRHGIPQPAFAVVSRADHAAAAVPLPAVLKPADSGGQRGLFMIERSRDADRYLDETLAASRAGEAMLEQYVEGVEVNTLFAVRGGEPTLLTISDRLRPPGPGFGVGWIHSFPSSLSPDVLREIELVAAAAIRALGLRDGIAFPQLIAAENGVVVVEVAARIAAGQMADLVRHGIGVELYEIAIAQATGRPVPDRMVTGRFLRPIAIKFLTASPGVLPLGTVRAVSGLDRVLASKGVLDAGLYFGVGAEIGPLRVDADRRGYVVATGDTVADALAHASSAALELKVETDAASRPAWCRAGLLAAAFCVALVAATAAALVVSEGAKLQRPLVAATKVDKTFSPVCGCGAKIAHVVFRLLRHSQTVVDVVNSSGAIVSTLVHRQPLGPGPLHLEWTGRGADGRLLPNGRYYPEVIFPQLDRTLRLPSPILLDTDRPVIERAQLSAHGNRVVVRYRFSEAAQAALLVGGRRVVLTRFAPLRGTILWRGRVRRAVTLVAIDPAGNRSRPHSLAHWH